ncbi:hypothetical protein CIHG_06338 [Coccidioides immitis H538.4]|uniref:Uncharacterized protein n=3 Tax=Coccidioides immitis TaxID=5501 RepID=A0A0J8QRP8_COCIT|nr:hypothetical protein CIRG_09618 [Coccidioides immitis RMSCC 2394]KMU75379.1 hypothetical protein CISG_04798 [Coccidioides immitis RMSCC 3703]KMU88538.1 hypothetical protein CIHG_06338 [Coccidioides immitis H538.4]
MGTAIFLRLHRGAKACKASHFGAEEVRRPKEDACMSVPGGSGWSLCGCPGLTRRIALCAFARRLLREFRLRFALRNLSRAGLCYIPAIPLASEWRGCARLLAVATRPNPL